MTIARYENFTINNLTFGTDSFGDYTTTITKWFDTRGRVKDVRNGVQITKDERVYTDLTTFTVNYTPNTRRIVDYQNLYSICLLYTSPSPRDRTRSRMPSSA